jgi:hypothetical protein
MLKKRINELNSLKIKKKYTFDRLKSNVKII